MTIVLSVVAGLVIGWLTGYAIGWVVAGFSRDPEDQYTVGVASMIVLAVVCAIAGGIASSYFGFWVAVVWSLGAAVLVPLTLVGATGVVSLVDARLEEERQAAVYNSPATLLFLSIGCVRWMIGAAARRKPVAAAEEMPPEESPADESRIGGDNSDGAPRETSSDESREGAQ